MEASDDLGVHYDAIVDQLSRGGVTPFLGAGVNLLMRPESPPWEWSAEQGEYLPNGGELARHLATMFRFPAAERPELLRVAQYAVALRGAEPLYTELRRLFDRNYPPNALHR